MSNGAKSFAAFPDAAWNGKYPTHNNMVKNITKVSGIMTLFGVVSNIVLFFLVAWFVRRITSKRDDRHKITKSKKKSVKTNIGKAYCKMKGKHSRRRKRMFVGECGSSGTDENTHGIITVTQAVELLGVSRSTVYKMISDDKLKAQKVNGRWMIEKYSLNDKIRGSPVS